MSKRIKRHVEDFPEWVRDYVVHRTYERRRNQYSTEKTISHCVSVDVVPFKIMASNAKSKTLKWMVSGRCSVCGLSFTVNWNNVWLRKRHRGEEVCGRCCRKESYTDEWRKANSEAQKQAQGNRAARKRMSDKLKQVHRENPEIRKKISKGLKRAYRDNPELRQKISKASRRNWKNAEYQDKVSPKGFYHGYFNSRCGRVFYASSWELAFLTWCEKNDKIESFRRCDDHIKYRKPSGGIAYYHPDFEILWTNGRVEVAEVKGSMQSWDVVNRKRVAAQSYYGESKSYWIAFKEDLKRIGCFVGAKKVSEWIQKLSDDGVIDSYGKGKSSKAISLQGKSSRPLREVQTRIQCGRNGCP